MRQGYIRRLKDGSFEEARLVSKYNGVHGFHKLTDEQRKEHGWYPAFISDEEYDPLTEYQIKKVAFDEETEQGVITFKTLPLSKKEVRKNKIREGFPFLLHGKTYQIREVDDTLDRLAIHQFRAFSTILIKFDESTFVEMTKSEYTIMLQMMASFIQECYNDEAGLE